MTSLTHIFPSGFDARLYTQVNQEPAHIRFIQELESHGLHLQTLESDGKIHRVRTDEDKRGKESGWYVFYEDDCPAGSFGDWRHDWKINWCSKAETEMSADERQQFRARMEAAQTLRAQEQAANYEYAQRRAEKLWEAVQPASAEHPYLAAKQVQPHGLGVNEHGQLVVPLSDQDGALWTLQFISEDGDKKYLKGGKRSGTFYAIEGATDRVYVVEGFATGASVAEATGATVIVACDTQALLAAGEAVRAQHPTAQIVFAADNDITVKDNPGVTAANKAANAVGGKVQVPAALNSQKTDWNDVAVAKGLDSVKHQLEPETRARPLLMWASDLAQNVSPPRFLVYGLKELDSLGVEFGGWGTGKSVRAMDEAIRVSLGLPVQDRQTSPGLVLYILGEGQGGVGRRLAAWAQHHSRSLSSAFVAFTTRAVPFLDPSAVAQLESSVAELSEAAGAAPSAIYLDTIARNFGAGDESKNQDMQRFVDAIDTHLRLPFGACVTLVHHTGHMDKERARGASVLPAACDWEYRIERVAGDIISMTCTKTKDFEAPPALYYQLVGVPLVLDGETTSSVTVEQTTYQPADPSTLKPKAQQFLALFHELLERNRANLEASGYDPENASVSVEQLREAATERKICTTNRQTFSDRKKEVSGILEVENGAFRLVGPSR